MLFPNRCIIRFVNNSSPLSVQQFCCRLFRISSKNSSAVVAAEGNVSKQALMELRKRTGYSISKCKEAILKYGDNLTQAEEWLQTTARKEGWDKITKRANVAATQGLFGMVMTNVFAAIVEVNCQTDFVARNEKFRALVAQISRGIFNDAATNYRLENDDISSKWNLSYDRLADNGLDFGKTLPNLLADNAGHLGEKITIGGAYIMRVAGEISLAGYVHPRSVENIIDGIPTGHFATLVAIRADKDTSEQSKAALGMQLCQHIIGMNPKEIGQPPDPESSKQEAAPETVQSSSNQEPEQQEGQEEDEDDRESKMNAQHVTKLSNETTLLRQDFMLEPEITVHEFLRQHNANVVDFVRLERGAISAIHAKKE